MSEEDLVLTKTLADRIKYVRGNLLDEHGKPLTQPSFAKALEMKDGHHSVMAWERKGREPKAPTRELLSALTERAYRPEVFSRSGAEVIVVETAVPLLRTLAAKVEELPTHDDLVESIEKLRISLQESQATPNTRETRPAKARATRGAGKS